MTMTEPAPAPAARGLKGVVVADTALGGVRGAEGFYHYRQHSAVELATTRPFEDTWQLLFDGHLPSSEAERAAFCDEVRPLRALPPGLTAALPALAAAPTLDALRAALSLGAAELGTRPVVDLAPHERRRDALRVAAVTPTLVAALHRSSTGATPVAPRDDLGHAANYLWMLTGAEPEPAAAAAIERYLTATVDHGFNASTFTARVVVHCTAARPAGRSSSSTRSAPRSGPRRSCGARSPRASGSWGSATPCTGPRTRAR